MQMPNTELDLSVHPRTVRVCENINTIHTLPPSQKPVTSDRMSRDPNSDRRNNKSKKERAVNTKINPRQTVKRTGGERQHAPQSSRWSSDSGDRRNERGQDGRDLPSESSRSTPRNKTGSRTRRDGTPPNDDDGDSSNSDHCNSDRRGVVTTGGPNPDVIPLQTLTPLTKVVMVTGPVVAVRQKVTSCQLSLPVVAAFAGK